MNNIRSHFPEWRLHLTVVVLSVIAELIGVLRIPLGIGSVLLLPLFYSFILALFLNPNVVNKAAGWLTEKPGGQSTPIILISVLPFLAQPVASKVLQEAEAQ
ncbi:DUF3100 domain-containing protein [Pokkaliibacter plantistimulans]|uniref:DUF3100 domain-containing protein n=1 Tax=Pokkaliibacter plantistimulans TaxID=1635171 RepID=UPI001402FBD1|nr:DUF3100 domain-containing protein [Pokkaliibacter plantistimulans]